MNEFIEVIKRLKRTVETCDFCGEEHNALDTYRIDSTDRRFNICEACIFDIFGSLQRRKELVRVNLENVGKFPEESQED